MKRWQDRGEVQDSDDEANSLEKESQSSERLRKKPRLDDDGEDDVEQRNNNSEKKIAAGDSEDGAEAEDWIHPRIATTYSKKAKSSKAPEPTSSNSPRKTGAASPLVIPSSRKQRLEFEPIADLRSSPSQKSENLPSLDEIFATRYQASEVPREDWHHVGSSPLSSPLTEREVSPPSPLFQSPRPAQRAVPSDGEAHALPGQGDVEVLAGFTMAGRRSLRARQEKQLHPYMFDKAQYQRQCRERGLRPVRLMEASQRAAETQDVYISDAESNSSQPMHLGHSNPLSTDSEPNDEPLFNHIAHDQSNFDSDEELPELRQPTFRTLSGPVNREGKRRKLVHAAHAKPPSTEASNAGFSQQEDDFSIPPSPPSTSSDSVIAGRLRTVAPGFRMPRGLTPAPLPTPQISSDSRLQVMDEEDVLPDIETSTNRSRPSTGGRLRTHNAVATDSSSDSSESEPDVQLDKRRMQREVKRIRGVLPASWLKIDLRARQKEASPSIRRIGQKSPSPTRTLLQKGVAQKIVQRRSDSPYKSNAIKISDDEDASDNSRLTPSPRMRQTKLQFDRQRRATAQSELVDIDDMEVDYVDSMLAGSSHRSSKPSGRKARQPRIIDAFEHNQRQRQDTSEEQKAIRRAAGVAKPRTKRSHGKGRVRGPKKSTAPHLSIVDALQGGNAGDERPPLFVRLAVRQAQKQRDRGRHSPTHKHIRLSTMDDTEDALSVFRAWREGTMVPHRTTQQKSGNSAIDLTREGSQESIHEPVSRSREPLSDLSPNKQQRLPGPIRRNVVDHKPNRNRVQGSKQPRMKQGHLGPITISDRPVADASEIPRNQGAGPSEARKMTRSRLHVQSQQVRYHAAQLESLETEFDREHRAAAFERTMNRLTRHIPMTQRREISTDFQMARFLNESDAKSFSNPGADATVNQSAREAQGQPPELPRSLPHRPRKRRPRRIDADAREFRQPSEPLPDVIDVDPLAAEAIPNSEVLQGLGRLGTRYATDFDVLPLSIGTYFHESSFIGSGDFAASLDFAGRNLDISTGHIRIHLDGEVWVWGAWSEDVAAGLSRIPGAVSDALQNFDTSDRTEPDGETKAVVLLNIDYLLRSAVRYLIRCVSFLDAVDRQQCVQALERLVDDLVDSTSEYSSTVTSNYDVLARVLQYALVISGQAFQLCDHSLFTPDTKIRVRRLVVKGAHRLANHLFPSAFQGLRSFYENNRHASKREAGIRDNETAVCGTVVLRHVTQGLDGNLDSFWSAIYQATSIEVTKLSHVNELDRVWFDLFTIQPTLEIDPNGILRHGSRLEGRREDWSLAKQLVDRVFNLYHPTSSEYGATMNDYVRAILSRCGLLMSRWGWWRCESILGVMFDFFARRGLAQLHNEESRGSPRFFEELTQMPSLEVQIEDRSFHIFLKMLVSGFQGILKHGIYHPRKLGGIAWRFIPNHGRTHRKDSELRQEDLDALRNHHDLLCTLYYCTPHGNRLGVELIRNLVDHAASHREACRVNVRAWAYLASFQISTNEGIDELVPFNAWYRDMLSTTITQFRLARTEVEREVSSADAQGKSQVSRDIIEDTIARNQRQIAATLVDLLSALKRALRSASSLTSASTLVVGSVFWQVVDLFDSSSRILRGPLEEAIEAIKAALEVQQRFSKPGESQPLSDDSQDYGDTSALQALASTQAAIPNGNRCIAEIIHVHVGHLVSNLFGADSTADDGMLAKLVDVWTQVAHLMIKNDKQTWTSYICDYNANSWYQLRDTPQRRKFTPYFLSRVLEVGDIDLNETDIFASWLKCLVDREAVLKFQHALTNALLNHAPDEPLIVNLPFSHDARSLYNISLPELRQRRLALLSAVLHNMRNSVDSAIRNQPHSVQKLRRRYGGMLRQLMQATKNNYQELLSSHSGEVADNQAQGTYVDFVQQLVSFLQQYTTDICPIDRFFMDSAVFPLPSTDPTYVTGRLRSYVPKLSEGGKKKELAVFIQTVGERAVVDSQQAYLVNQFVAATASTLETGDSRVPSLRHVLCTAIFPAYIEAAFSSPSSWIVAIPILEACGKIAGQLLYSVRLEDENSVQAIIETLLALVQSMTQPIKAALRHPGLLSLPHVQSTLATIFHAVRQCLTCTFHLTTIAPTAQAIVGRLTRLHDYAKAVDAHMRLTNDVDDVDEPEDPIEQIPRKWNDTREFAFKHVKDKFSKDWYAQDGQYFVKRGNTSVEVVVSLREEEEERSHLLDAIREFLDSFETIIGSGHGTMNGLHRASSVGDVFV